MQDRYAGDIGDFGKFAMLRALATTGLSIGINWYLVPTPPQELAVNDGQKLIPSNLAACDPDLAQALLAISKSPNRSVHTLEEADLVPGARYYSDVVPVEDRAAWHARAFAVLVGSDLVFCDPDNGLLVKSVGKRSAKAPKYTFYEEVSSYVARGQSVVVYNHRSRKKPDVYFREICEKLASAVPQASDTVAITFRKGSVRDYFAICANLHHAKLVREAFGELASGVWGKVGMCEIQNLPHQPAHAFPAPNKRGEASMTAEPTTTTTTRKK